MHTLARRCSAVGNRNYYVQSIDTGLPYSSLRRVTHYTSAIKEQADRKRERVPGRFHETTLGFVTVLIIMLPGLDQSKDDIITRDPLSGLTSGRKNHL